MLTLEELKQKWGENRSTIPGARAYDQKALEEILKSRAKKNVNTAMQYFWASFVLQILTYALLSHVLVRYWSDIEVSLFSICGILLFLPFTIMIMRKFKGIALTKPTQGEAETSLYEYVFRQHALLLSFYNFKKRYELILIPLISAIGTMLIFKLYVPGGVFENPGGSITTFAITLFSCGMAIRAENKKSFEQPLHQLQGILAEFSEFKI